ncbi:type III toxin-antitoxin system ToxN/AbiQ family toxin [Bacillus thuringiensis]|uniref:type III toxin-antitoxin system ToxN/AbiQ family toxin n=1 Tax=Bacillus thuringiensis TaxID=1428 RepID=UPI001EDE011E|nr:type III toxin-antitoxin system ToxN/AbiQ family toxin [Bacillus thuringiensis]MCG3426773.1 type III toxin-antitoxin system ToxN/AbiQ family toxin [Bacillus thuringiensis]
MSSEVKQLDFFRATDKYITFLQNIESKIMDNRHDGKLRTYLGVLITIGVHQYFAPLTSYKEDKHGHIKNSDQSCVIIYGKDREEDDDKKIALLNINNMFPSIITEMTKVDFDKESEKNKAFLEKEYRFIVSNQDKIIKKAQKLHKLITEKNIPALKNKCCDFKKLEQEYIKFAQ